MFLHKGTDKNKTNRRLGSRLLYMQLEKNMGEKLLRNFHFHSVELEKRLHLTAESCPPPQKKFWCRFFPSAVILTRSYIVLLVGIKQSGSLFVLRCVVISSKREGKKVLVAAASDVNYRMVTSTVCIHCQTLSIFLEPYNLSKKIVFKYPNLFVFLNSY